ncbi:hypothetical protein HYFRA_00013959, partial [Hymenoscyphus fraxineus]
MVLQIGMRMRILCFLSVTRIHSSPCMSHRFQLDQI